MFRSLFENLRRSNQPTIINRLPLLRLYFASRDMYASFRLKFSVCSSVFRRSSSRYWPKRLNTLMIYSLNDIHSLFNHLLSGSKAHKHEHKGQTDARQTLIWSDTQALSNFRWPLVVLNIILTTVILINIVCPAMNLFAITTRKLCYRKDDRATRAI